MDSPLDACVTPKFTSLFVMRMQTYENSLDLIQCYNTAKAKVQLALLLPDRVMLYTYTCSSLCLFYSGMLINVPLL